MNIRVHLITAMLLMGGLTFLFAKPYEKSKVEVVNLTTETRTGLLALNVLNPCLSWEISSSKRNVRQMFYQIIVASSPEKLNNSEGDLWDSGKVRSDKSIRIPYAGKTLTSRQECFWKVRVWCGKKGNAYSEQAFWQMGLLNDEDWKAKWIGLDRSFDWDEISSKSRLSARYFRKEFPIDDNIIDARLYLAGLGMFELYVNGQKIGDQVLAPSSTDYTQQVKYITFDLKPYLKKGKNAVGVILGNGRFFNPRQNTKPQKHHNYGFPKMLFQLEVKKVNGTTTSVLSDSSWKVTSDGPIRTNNEFNGEEYDCGKEFPGWNLTGFDDSKWLSVELVSDPGENRKYFAGATPIGNEPKTPHGDLTLKIANRVAQVNENMKVMARLKPISIKMVSPDVYILDMGQNMTGCIKIWVSGEKGRSVKLRFAESLQPDGNIYVTNLRTALNTDIYTLRGSGVEVWNPSFVFHGFRFVEVSNWPGVPSIDNFEGLVEYDAMPTIGQFESSDEMLNAIYKNAWWGISGNYKGMPVDCPQRDERQPWLGDRSTGSLGESFLFDNQRLYSKWMDDIQESMSQEGQIPDVAPNYYNYYTDNVTWPGTYLMVGYMLYHQFGDVSSLRKHYPYMKKWLDYMKSHYMKDYIMTRDKYGDWCLPPESLELIHSKDTTRITDGSLIATAYLYRMYWMMQEFATVLGKPEEKAEFKALAANIASAFQKNFYHPEEKYYSNNTATANILPLAFGLTPDKDIADVFKHVEKIIEVDNNSHIASGVIGMSWLMRTLSKYGRKDLAFKIATNKTYPSWGYMKENGATTIWELWNGNTAQPWMNSQNHVMLLGDLLIWYYENIAGIKCNPDTPGFKKIIMNPDFPDGLTFVNAQYKSMYGLIKSYWTRGKENLVWNIEIPSNTEAEVYLPAEKKLVLENGVSVTKADGVKFIRNENGRSVFQIGSGKYKFEIKKGLNL